MIFRSFGAFSTDTLNYLEAIISKGHMKMPKALKFSTIVVKSLLRLLFSHFLQGMVGERSLATIEKDHFVTLIMAHMVRACR